MTNPTGAKPALLHYEAGKWKNITTSINTRDHIVSGETSSFSPFAVVVEVPNFAYSWSGVLQPINQDGSSIFKMGSTVPVKFRLTGNSAGYTGLEARLSIAKLTDNVLGTYAEAA
ncbi:MAG: hypothetical protein C4321_06725, partial [Chloroflexota bacterium]